MRLDGEAARAYALRAVALVLVTVLAVALARRLGYYEVLPPLPLPFLYGRALAWQTLLVGGVVATLALLALLSKDRAPQLLVGLAVGLVLWLSFPYSRLRWYRFFPGAPALKRLEGWDATAWLLAAALLAVAAGFALAEGARQTRDAYREKGVREEPAAAARTAVARGAARTLVVGAGGGAALVALFALGEGALAPALAGLPRVNPVLALLALGLALALAIGALLRGRGVASGEVEPLSAGRERGGP